MISISLPNKIEDLFPILQEIIRRAPDVTVVPLFINYSSGNIGIGTTSPGTINGNTAIFTGTTLNVTNTAGISRIVSQGTSFGALHLVATSSSANKKHFILASGSDKFTIFSIDDSDNGTAIFNIDPAGLITGIGTSLGAWTTWTPSFTGFSANPTVTSSKYCLIGKTCFVSLVTNAAGTSNATSFTVTLPFNAKNDGQSIMLTLTEDNGAFLTTPGFGVTTSGNSTLTLFKDTGQSAGWTNANSKRADFNGIYEIA